MFLCKIERREKVMVKYEMSDGKDIDFFAELKMVNTVVCGECVHEVKPEEENEQDMCMITHLPLTENSVKMECGHTFNYGPLFHDIFNHKTKFNVVEYRKLSYSEIRCPYCRNIQRTLLPYLDGNDVNYPKVHGVNFIDMMEIEPIVINTMCEGKKGKCMYCYTADDVYNQYHEASQENKECENTYVYYVSQLGQYLCGVHKYVSVTKFNDNLKLLKVEAKKAVKKAIAEEKKAEKKADAVLLASEKKAVKDAAREEKKKAVAEAKKAVAEAKKKPLKKIKKKTDEVDTIV